MTEPLPSLPPKLLLVTVSLQLLVVFNALVLLMLPFSRDNLSDSLAQASQITGQPMPQFTSAELDSLLWTMFFWAVVTLVASAIARSGAKDGKRWAWGLSLFIASALLVLFPFGTPLGIVMLFGLFDKSVRAFLSH